MLNTANNCNTNCDRGTIMKKALLIFTLTALFISFISTSISAEGSHLKNRYSYQPNIENQRQKVMKYSNSSSEGWSYEDWQWIIEDGYEGMIDLILEIAFDPKCESNPEFSYGIHEFKDNVWVKWNSWSKTTIKCPLNYSFINDYDSRGRVTKTVITNYFNIFYYYDTQGRVTEAIFTEAPDSLSIEDAERKLLNWDTEKIVSAINKEWDNDTQDWLTDYKTEFIYNSDNDPVESISSGWNLDTENWDLEEKYVYSYNSDGYINQEIVLPYDSSTSTWINGMNKDSFAYDTDGHLTEHISYNSVIDSDPWLKINKDLYTYDSDGNLLEDSEYSWHKASNSWMPNGEKKMYTYDSNGNISEYIKYQCWVDSGQWVPKERKLHTFNQSENISETIQYEWNTGIGNWKEGEKYTFAYNAKGDPDYYVVFDSDSVTGSWISPDTIPIIIEYQTAINSDYDKAFKGSQLLRIAYNNSQLTFSVEGITKTKARIYDLQGKLVTELYPKKSFAGTLYIWNNTKYAAGKVYVFSLQHKERIIIKSIVSVN